MIAFFIVYIFKSKIKKYNSSERTIFGADCQKQMACRLEEIGLAPFGFIGNVLEKAGSTEIG
jgi:hypothetical protein